MNEVFPDPIRARWLDSHALPDETLGEAYESLGNAGRAVLKQCIARLYRIWGELPLVKTADTRYDPDFRLEVEESPAGYALFVCEGHYGHPAALLAAVMPSIFARVETVLPCFVPGNGADRPAAPLLAAMELAGIEQCFWANTNDCRELLRILEAERIYGRLILLGSSPFGEDLVLAAHAAGVPCRSLVTPPVYRCADTNRLLAQRFGATLPENTPVTEEHAGEHPALPDPLRLDRHHENIWLWPDLAPDWFRNRRMRLTSQEALIRAFSK